MFSGCTNLTVAPDLPAATLAKGCYESMFNGCSNLRVVKCLATDISANSSTGNWLIRVASSGTFVKAAGMDVWPSDSDAPEDWHGWTRGKNGIPKGWTVRDDMQ